MGVRVLVADSHRLTMEAVKGYLSSEDGTKVVAEARSGHQALELVARANPDVALIDMNLPGAVDGLTCVERIRRNFPETKVVVISASADEAVRSDGFPARRPCLYLKSRRPARPRVGAPPDDPGHRVPRAVGDDEGEEWLEGLTKRELAVLKGVAAGLPNRDIGQRLWVTEHTVKFHLTNIFRKLQVANRTEAARWAHQRGLVQDVA